MNEFLNRLDIQRQVLEAVNGKYRTGEELCGLSKRAIERWLNANQIGPRESIRGILFQISSKLFFLANKSQEQITQEYRLLSGEVECLKSDLQRELARELN